MLRFIFHINCLQKYHILLHKAFFAIFESNTAYQVVQFEIALLAANTVGSGTLLNIQVFMYRCTAGTGRGH